MFKYGQNKTTKYTHVVFMLIFTLRYSQTYYVRSHINPLKQPYLHFFTYTLWACLFFLQLHIRYFRLKHEVSISSTLNVNFFVRMLFWQLLLCTCNQKKAAKTMFVRKILVFNVDEIDWRFTFSVDYVRPKYGKRGAYEFCCFCCDQFFLVINVAFKIIVLFWVYFLLYCTVIEFKTNLDFLRQNLFYRIGSCSKKPLELLTFNISVFLIYEIV